MFVAIQYVRIEDRLNIVGLNLPNFRICDNTRKDFSILRAQLNTEFRFDSLRGPHIVDNIHNEKCCRILEMQVQNSSDLLLFPEYCVSYDLLDTIIANNSLWPQENTLWCLPCQGIAHTEFLATMEKYESQGVTVIKDAYTTNIDIRNFINALIYCFIAFSITGERHIVLVPQIKTCPMRDTGYDCEAHMSLGNTVFVFGLQNGLGLISLLCADSLNQEISWRNLSDQCRSLILLHPQLNANCKNITFRQIRTDMFAQGNKHIYISCNWAQNTKLLNEDLKSVLNINTPWSCIYYKYETSYRFEQWYENNLRRLKLNATYLLYGGFLSQEKVAVWYAYPYELIHKIIAQKPYHRQPAVLESEECVVVTAAYSWNETRWDLLVEESEKSYRVSHYCNYLNEEYKELFTGIVNDGKYNYPFACTDKINADQFLQLVLAETTLNYTCIDSNENLLSPAIIIDQDSLEKTEKALQEIAMLITQLKQGHFPKHLECYKQDHLFELHKEGIVYSNLTTSDKTRRLIVAITPDKTSAMSYIEHLKKGTLIQYSKEDDNDFPYKICVYAKRLGIGGYEHLPTFNPSTLAPERAGNRTKITLGGDDNV